jgi:CRISPR/Cas system endoribonuclease Cas6 (RAMP superfamily)
MRSSRRLEGQFTYDRDKRAYKDVIIYVEKGLGENRTIFSSLVHVIWRLQKGQLREYYVHCFGFGFTGDKLKHRGSVLTVRNRAMVQKTAQVLAEISGSEAPDKQSTLPKLFPTTNPYGRKGSVRSEDLLVFICRGPNGIIVPDHVQKKLDRLSRHRRTFWIYLNEESPQMQTEWKRRRLTEES